MITLIFHSANYIPSVFNVLILFSEQYVTIWRRKKGKSYTNNRNLKQ